MAEYEQDDGPLTPAQLEFIKNNVDQDRPFRPTKELLRNGNSQEPNEKSCRGKLRPARHQLHPVSPVPEERSA